MKPLRTTCARPGCRVIVDRGHCRAHGRERAAARRAVDARRGSASSRGYGAEWRVRRLVFLKQHPWCVDPRGRHRSTRRESEVVDHVVPLRAGGRDDESNWQALCASCHASKTVREDGGFGRPRIDRGAA